MIQDDKNYYNEQKISRDDWGGQVMAPQSGMPSQDQSKAFFMGSDEKPYPNDRNFVVGTGNDGFISKEIEPVVPANGDAGVRNNFGQVKYAKREGATSIYKDATRNTADDNEASRKAESSTIYEVEGEDEESQGGSI